MTEFTTKDSGERTRFDSGMQRDTETGKPRFDLMLPEGVPYADQMITRYAALLGRGAEKYDERNWEQANSKAELDRMKSSAFRHFMQWITGETDEDHAAAVIFNIVAAETTQRKLDQQDDSYFDAVAEEILSNKPVLEGDDQPPSALTQAISVVFHDHHEALIDPVQGVQRAFNGSIGIENLRM